MSAIRNVRGQFLHIGSDIDGKVKKPTSVSKPVSPRCEAASSGSSLFAHNLLSTYSGWYIQAINKSAPLRGQSLHKSAFLKRLNENPVRLFLQFNVQRGQKYPSASNWCTHILQVSVFLAHTHGWRISDDCTLRAPHVSSTPQKNLLSYL